MKMNRSRQTSLTGNRRAGTSGFSIIEVLVALVILSVGLLGLAALQAEGLRGTSAAIQRTTAVSYASDIADRMRANNSGLANYVVSRSDKALKGRSLTCGDDHVSGNPVNAKTCTATDMAQHDLFKWKAELGDRYEGLIESSADAENRYTITVFWTDRTIIDEDEREQSYQIVVQFESRT